jgi:hypothetical protein
MPTYIQKLRVDVHVRLVGQEPMPGSIWLGPQAEFHDGPETLLERLNAAVRVVPLLAADGTMYLLNPREVESVEPAPEVPGDLVLPPTWGVAREERVELRFPTGRVEEGAVRIVLPRDLNRVSDFMNTEDDFFPLVTSRGILLVNKDRVATTRLFASSPSPRPIEPGGTPAAAPA